LSGNQDKTLQLVKLIYTRLSGEAAPSLARARSRNAMNEALSSVAGNDAAALAEESVMDLLNRLRLTTTPERPRETDDTGKKS
jgi:hypothetical protein